MKTALAFLTASFLFAAAVQVSYAEETVGEKAAAAGNDVKRAVKKGVNRTQEALCMDGDVECAAKKAGNRVEEAKDATVDKAKEVKNKVD